MSQVSYRERLHPPIWWWLIAAGIWLSVALAVSAYLSWVWTVGLTAAVMALTGGLILQQAQTIAADQRGLRVGRAHIDWAWVGAAAALDQQASAAYLTSTQHHADFLAVRPYVPTAVRVELADPADPHPAWLVSSRRPDRLVAAVQAGIASGGTHHG